MKSIKILLLSVFIASALIADGEDISPLSPKNFIIPNLNPPVSADGKEEKVEVDDLKHNYFYLNMTPEELAAVQKKDKIVKDALYQFSQKEINYKPVIRPIASMDTISMHPYFTFTLLLPAGSIISYVDSSVEMAVLKHENNMLLLRPKSDFDIANLTIIYKLKDENKVISILAERYTVERGDKLNSIVSYVDKPKREALEVMDTFYRQNGAFPSEKYSYIKIDDIDYRIVQDDKYGNISVNNKVYRVDNNVIHK